MPTSHRPLLPFAAFAVLALCLAALTPSHAAADDNSWPGTDPSVRTDPATAITATTATLNGFVQTNGGDTTYTFEYGPTTAYGTNTPPQQIGRGQSGPVSAALTGLAPATVYHFRLRALHTNRPWEVARPGADQTFTTAPAPVAPAPPPAPAALPAAPVATLGASVVVAPVVGTVLVKVPGAKTYVPLGANGAVPVGAVLDTRKGTVQLTTALDGGRTQTATFHSGVFEVRQSARSHGLTDIFLRGPVLSCGRSRTSARAAAVSARKPPRKARKRQLWGRDKGGRFRTHGSTSVATVRGTSWVTTDTCAGTRTTVREGAVSVRDTHRHRTVLVKAGHSYLARRR